MILAGGRGERLYPLSRDRAKPAVPFGGKYRIIDFVLSNFINSGFFKIKILTQFKSDSLNNHISRGWRMSSQLMNQYMDLVPAQMRTGGNWYKGTADAIFQNLNLITDESPEYVLIFGGDHVYKMDVSQMQMYHKEKKSDITISAIPIDIELAKDMGVIVVDKEWRIIDFQEKPENPTPIPGDPSKALVSMGNYIFNKDLLLSKLMSDSKEKDVNSSHDFGKDILPKSIKTDRVYAYDFSRNILPGAEEKERGYWRDVGTIDAYYETNMDLVGVSPLLNLYNKEWPLYTWQPDYPPAKFVFANLEEQRVGYATDSLITEGCIISGGRVSHSIFSPAVRINSYSDVQDSILMEGVNVGRHAKIRKAIIDKNVEIPPNETIGYDLEKDKKRFFVSDSGIVVVPKKSIIE